MKIIKFFLKRQYSDGLFLAMCFLFVRLNQKLKSILYSKLFNAPRIDLGSGCKVFGKKHIKFGKDISIYKDLWLEAVSEYDGVRYFPSIVLGDRVKMSDRVHITAINLIEIGNDVLFGSNVYVSDHNHGAYSGQVIVHSSPSEAPAKRVLHSSGGVSIGNNVWIGDNVNIVGSVKIGNGAIIASNSVVRGDVSADTIMAGIPARPIKQFSHVSKKWEKYV